MHRGDYLPDGIILGHTILTAKQPSVYAWVRGEKFMYIGQSTKLLNRLAMHNIVNTPKNPLLSDDKILFWCFKTKNEAMLREMEMIMQYKPILNLSESGGRMVLTECLYCGKEFRLVKSWQRFCSKRCQTAQADNLEDPRPLE